MNDRKGPPPPPPTSRAFLLQGVLRTVYDLVPVGILLCTAGGRINHSNKRAQRMLGYDSQDLRGRTLQSLSDEGHEDAVPRVLEDLVDLPTGTVLNHRIRRKSGPPIFSRTAFTGIKDEHGVLQYLVVTLEDITDEVESRMRLSQRVSTLRLEMAEVQALLESLGEGVALVDMGGRFRLNNQISRDTLGDLEATTDLEGGPPKHGVFDRDRKRLPHNEQPLCRSLKRLEVIENEILFICNHKVPDGVWVIASSRPTYNKRKDQTGAVLVFRDITKIVESRKDLEKSNADLERFATVASHDLQEPPRQIAAFAARALDKYGEDLPERVITYLGVIQKSALRMQTLVSDLLAYSRVGRKGEAFEPVDVNRTIRMILQDMSVRVIETGAQVRFAPLPSLEGSPTQIRQLFWNLISNAIKFHKQGVAPEVDISCTTEGGKALFSVVDNGIGFDPKYQHKVFEIFRRLVGKSEYPGTGIGLALCRRIVDYHGGDITAHSTLGLGSRFTVTLPLKQNQRP